MSDQTELKLAVISDLHCEAYPAARDPETYLVANSLRCPPERHPVQALIKLIRSQSIKADVLVCPGDLTNRICPSGMMQAWDHLREIARELECRLLLVTIGNHDVNSRKDRPNPEPFYIAKNLHPDFPVASDRDKDSFWSRGFYLTSDDHTNTDFAVLNTVITHHDEQSAKRGTFDSGHVSLLEEALQKQYETRGKIHSKLGVAIMHHHPILHSSVNYSSSDVLEFGDQILDLLQRYNYRLIIHGHRHDPRIRRYITNGGEQLILGAGSFSASLKFWSSVTRNVFHLIKTNTTEATQGLEPVINFWERERRA